MLAKDTSRHVFRERIEEERGSYRLTYQPADARSSLATLRLSYREEKPDASSVAKAMELEFERWLKRFPAPTRVSAYDVKERLIQHSVHPAECHLMGYVRRSDDAIVRRWRILEESEMPADQRQPSYLARAYAGLPCRVREEDREKASRDMVTNLKRIGVAVALMLVIPLLVYGVRMGVPGLALGLTLLSLVLGGYRTAVFLGWRNPSVREANRQEREEQMEHCYYHCEKNPEAFARMKAENLERELADVAEREEAERVLRHKASPMPWKPAPGWLRLLSLRG
jgi:hypothetical protein